MSQFRNLMMTKKGGGEPWYVTDDMWALWDGINNAGKGVHLDNITVWKDLSGKGRDLSLPSSAVIQSNNILFDTNGAYIPRTTQEEVQVFARGWTIEVLVFVDTPRLGLLFGNGDGNFVRTYRTTDGLMRIGVSAAGNGIGTGGNAYTGYFRFGEIIGFSFCVDVENNISILYRNGIQNGVPLNFAGVYGTQYNRGGVGINTDAGFGRPTGGVGGNYYIARVYNRALTAEEVAYNYEIDKQRFGLE